jgi:hypothetical protein
MKPTLKKPAQKRPTGRRPATKGTRAAKQKQGSNLSWQRLLVILVAGVVVISLGRSLLPFGDFMGASGKGRDGNAAAPPVPKQTPQRIVEFNGKKIPIGEGPVAVLNPGLARPGGKIGVNASGFDPGHRVQVLLTTGAGKKKQTKVMATAKVNKYTVIDAQFTYPIVAANSGGKQVVTVVQDDRKKVARAEVVAQSGVGLMELSDSVGPPGTALTVDAQGFMPNEKINVFWGRITGAPSTVLTADESGGLHHVPLKVGVGAVGDNTVILVGVRSKTTAMAPFQLLRQYPMVLTKPFSARATETISLNGKGFAPNERVLVYFNEAGGTPVMTLQSDANGKIGGTSFKVPFGLKGRQTLIFVGEQSRASTKAGFLAQQYMPVVRTSTWGGLPGTVMNFYAKGFAPNEAVHVFVDGELVTAFRVNEKGAAFAVGSYMIPGDAQGKVVFKLVGQRSGGSGTSTVKVDKSEGPVKIPEQPKYKLPPDLKR